MMEDDMRPGDHGSCARAANEGRKDDLYSAESTRALMCLGVWSQLGYVHDSDVKTITTQHDLKEGEAEPELGEDWAKI
ncbi:hypothetical protein BJ912DRAFT_974652 [Pholiota molesta]|jgi:hypothetical protein|nr:hypothetical protein BJ912DRAFT_974652 [Pholiota molesta]